MEVSPMEVSDGGVRDILKDTSRVRSCIRRGLGVQDCGAAFEAAEGASTEFSALRRALERVAAARSG